jgi:hypothetical protein
MIGALILGIVAGFLGRLLMPGKDKMGFLATVLLGVAGSFGLPGAVLGVIALLWIYRMTLRDRRDKKAERRRDRMRPAL